MKQNIFAQSVIRPDARDKLSGTTHYIDDLSHDDIFYVSTFRSDRARAEILNITLPDLPENYYILDYKDIPGQNAVRMINLDMPFLAENYVKYIGEPILLVTGPDRRVIYDILESIQVDYKDLAPILNMDDASDHKKDTVFGNHNITASYNFCKGDPDKFFKKQDINLHEGIYTTGLQEQMYMEPQGMVAYCKNDRMTVTGSMQCPYYVKNALILGLDMNESNIQVIQTSTGGAFGGKEEFPSLIAGHAAFAALKTGKTVKLIYDRQEDVNVTTKRHPSRITYKTALDSKNMITAMEVTIELDGGAYTGLSPVVLQRAMFAAGGVYHIPNIHVEGKVYGTNNVPNGAFRGFGAPQTFFAIETHMEEIAKKLDIPILEFKNKHLISKNQLSTTGGVMRDDIKMDKILELIDLKSRYSSKRKEFMHQTGKGIGISLFLHGCGFTGKGEEIIQGTAAIKKNELGQVEILVSNVEMGQGAQTALRKIVASSLELPLSDIIYDNPDTDRVPDSGPTVASRTTMVVGSLLEQAAIEMKSRWSESKELIVTKKYTHPSYIRWDQDSMTGDAYPSYSWGINVVEVSYDNITHEIRTEGVWGIYDIGIAIDRVLAEGQMAGGVLQGLGYASLENMTAHQGKIIHNSMTDYIVPTCNDFPEIFVDFVDNPYKYGPKGAKCAGELPMAGVAPAYVSAVSQATGLSIRDIPVTPENLLQGKYNEGH